MRSNKRALALWLGLFFCLLTALAAQEVAVDGGALWVEDDGAATYWHSGFALTFGEYYFLSADVGQVAANLPWADGTVLGFKGQGGFDMPRGGVAFAVGSMSHQRVGAAVDKIVVSNDGGAGFFMSIHTPLRFGAFSAAPYVLYGEASWTDGDLYWFFGKPKLPSLLLYGADFTLDQFDRYQHALRAYGFSAKLDITSNENEPLFATAVDAGLFCYQFSQKGEKLNFTGTLGWVFAKASLDGALTSSNQPYFLFPFLLYHLDAHLDLQAGFAGFRFQHTLGIFQYSLNLGALHIFHDQGGVDIHYQMKKLFSGQEVFDSLDFELKGLGAAFLVIDAGFPALPITKKLRLSLGLQKVFAIPWGYERFLDSDGAAANSAASDSLSPDAANSLLRTVLLSGLFIRGSLKL